MDFLLSGCGGVALSSAALSSAAAMHAAVLHMGTSTHQWHSWRRMDMELCIMRLQPVLNVFTGFLIRAPWIRATWDFRYYILGDRLLEQETRNLWLVGLYLICSCCEYAYLVATCSNLFCCKTRHQHCPRKNTCFDWYLLLWIWFVVPLQADLSSLCHSIVIVTDIYHGEIRFDSSSMQWWSSSPLPWQDIW